MNGSTNQVAPMNKCLDSMRPQLTSQIVLTVMYAVIFPISLLGNSLVLYVVYRRRSMRNVLNLLIVNMAVADLIVTIFIMPYSTGYIYVNHRWFGGLFGEILCKTVQFSLTTSIAASIFTMTVMTIDRFVAIVYVWRRSLTLGTSKIAVAVIWALSLACMGINLYVYRVGKAEGRYWCYPQWEPAFDNEESPAIFMIIVFVALYLLPLLLMAVLYTIICYTLWQKSYAESLTTGRSRRIDASKKRVIKMLITIVISFGVCWLPLHISHYYIYFELMTYLCWPRWLKLSSFWLGHANSAINPCIYVYFNKTFRRAFLDALHIHAFDSLQTNRPTTITHRNGHVDHTHTKAYESPQLTRSTLTRASSNTGSQRGKRWFRGRDSYKRLRALSLRNGQAMANGNTKTYLEKDADNEVVIMEKVSVL